MSYQVFIRCRATGQTRIATCTLNWDGEDGDWYWWSDGNNSCDCNRELDFRRAGGERPATNDPSIHCSDGRFQVLRFLLPDGRLLEGPDA